MGGEAGVSNPQMEKMKTFFRAFTILLIPITAQFPTVRAGLLFQNSFQSVMILTTNGGTFTMYLPQAGIFFFSSLFSFDSFILNCVHCALPPPSLRVCSCTGSPRRSIPLLRSSCSSCHLSSPDWAYLTPSPLPPTLRQLPAARDSSRWSKTVSRMALYLLQLVLN